MESKSLNKDDLNGRTTPQNMNVKNRDKDQYELILNWYRLNSRQLVGEEVLDRLQINTLLKILGNPIWNDMYHCWAIENKHMSSLQKFIKHEFDPDMFMYFIEAFHTP